MGTVPSYSVDCDGYVLAGPTDGLWTIGYGLFSLAAGASLGEVRTKAVADRRRSSQGARLPYAVVAVLVAMVTYSVVRSVLKRLVDDALTYANVKPDNVTIDIPSSVELKVDHRRMIQILVNLVTTAEFRLRRPAHGFGFRPLVSVGLSILGSEGRGAQAAYREDVFMNQEAGVLSPEI